MSARRDAIAAAAAPAPADASRPKRPSSFERCGVRTLCYVCKTVEVHSGVCATCLPGRLAEIHALNSQNRRDDT